MNFKLRIEKATFTLERPYNCRSTPALSISIDGYELNGDVEQLIEGVGQILKTVSKTEAEVGTTTKRETEYNDFLAGLKATHGGNGEDADVPQ